jgi:hypothetical protein
MPVYRHWALVAVSFTHEADDLEHADGLIRDMSVLDWAHEVTVNTMTEIEVAPDEWEVVVAEQPSLFGEEAPCQVKRSRRRG